MWFNADDKLHGSPALTVIPKRWRAHAMGVWLFCGTYTSDQLTDGYVPDEVFEACGGTPLIRRYLTEAGFLEDDCTAVVLTAQHCRIPTASEVQAERTATATRVRNHRTRKKVTADQARKEDVTPLPPEDTTTHVTVPPGNGIGSGSGVVTPSPTSKAAVVTYRGMSLGPKRPKRAAAIAEDWCPAEDVLTDLQRQFPTVNVRQVVPEFRDFWLGTGKPMKDWIATFRNRLRTLSAQAPRNGHQVRGADKKVADWQSLKEEQ